MFWTRPKSIKVITKKEDFYNLASRKPSSNSERTFILRCDIDKLTPQPFLYPCRIIGECKTTSPVIPSDEYARRYISLNFDFDKVSQDGSWRLENLWLRDCTATFEGDKQEIIGEGIVIWGDNVGLTINDNASHVLRGVLILRGVSIVAQDDNLSKLLIKNSNFDIRGVEITRGAILGLGEKDTIIASDYASGIIDNVSCRLDDFLTAYLIYLNCNLAVEGNLMARNIYAEKTKRVLNVLGKGIKHAIGENIVCGASLIANGIKINDGTIRNLRLWTNPAGAGAIDIANGGRLSESYIYSDTTNGAVEADVNTEITRCTINTPTAGKVGVHVVNVGATRGLFNWNKGYGAGNHCNIEAAVADYTTKFNSNCNIVNPKADSAYNS